MASFELRCVEADRIYGSALQLATTSQNPLALAAARFLSPDQCYVTRPFAEDGLWGLQGKPDSTVPSITPLFPEDKEVHDYFANLLETDKLVYMENERSIYLPAGKFSDAVGGLVLLHEGLHAYAHKSGFWRDSPGRWSHWLEEAHVFAAELSILHALQPRLYRQIVTTKAADLYSKNRDAGFCAYDTLVSDEDAFAMVESFGETPRPHDIALMKGLLGIGAVYYMFSTGFTLSDVSLTNSVGYLHYLYAAPNDPVRRPCMKMPPALPSAITI